MLTGCRSVELNPKWYPHGVGRDHLYIAAPNGKYSIEKTNAGNLLSVHSDDDEYAVVLALVNDYMYRDGKLYVHSKEGYCVVDEEQNTAQVLLTVKDQRFANSGTEDEAVTYLASFDEFLDEAKYIFGVMDDFWQGRDEVSYGSGNIIDSKGKITPFAPKYNFSD